MRTEYISKGFQFFTEEGYAVCDSYNGSIVYCTEYIVDPDTEEVERTENRGLTLDEIAAYVKEWDRERRNHKLAWKD